MNSSKSISAVDLFCGAGGLSYGLKSAGISIKLGVDLDQDCAFPFEKNIKSEFVQADVSSLKASVVKDALKGSKYKLLAGCAPCQPFSTYSRSTSTSGKGRHVDWELLESFSRIVGEVDPELVTIENVPPLAQQKIFTDFVLRLSQDYWVDWRILDCSKIGLPQTRKRLILLASKLGPIEIPEFDYPVSSVRSAIGNLPSISAGGQDAQDHLHKASKLSSINLKRIKSSVPGGTWRDWPKALRSECHKKESGATYPAVYGRMEWDLPSPTITTQCFGYGNGRFGHPDQDRAISLREAAMLQGFPQKYLFVPKGSSASFAKIGKLIGNAVPVNLGHVIGNVLKKHISQIS